MARTASGEDLVLGTRYHCHRLLKGGDGVDTYLADDLMSDGTAVVVKHVLADRVPLAVRLRLEHEAAVLTRLSRATFQPLLAFERDGNHLYLVQPLLEGQTLAQRLAGGSLSVASTLVVASDVLSALQRVHEHDVLHRDLKPGNVVVQGGEPVARALLIDFGLARSASLHGDLRDEAVGTARYLAPEQAGLTDVAVDERSDLYSLGAVLYECLAGRPPFEAATVGEVLRQHLSQEPAGLRAAGVPVPRALEAVVLRLLAKDPGQRYQSAAAALADVEAVANALRRGISDPRIVIGLHDRRSTLAEPAFVGRATELAALGLALDRARQGRGGLVLLEAESGGGKTRLLGELSVQASRRGAWVLRGQGVDQAGQLPFQLLGGVVAGIESAASEDPGLVDRILGRLGDHADAVAGALPALATLLGRDEADLPEAHGETRSLQALPTLFDALGAADRPALVLLDDCQWADGLTVKFLKAWGQTRTAAGRHVAVVAAFRSEEVGADHPLRALDQGDTVQVRPLTPSETQDLAESMAGPLPVEAHTTLSQLAEGSPFMAAAVLRGMVECGALVDSPQGWTVEASLLADVQTSRRAALFLVRRLERLSPDALRLLTTGAVLGKEFDLSLAVSLSGQVASEVAPALEEARRRRVLWVDAGGTCQFLHDKLREAVLGRLSEAERTALHGRAAEQIEAVDPGRSFELAYHFDAAHAPARCLPYALASAEHARRQHNLEIAEAHYRMALRSSPGAGASVRARLVEGLGDVLTLRGSYLEAGQQFELAQTLSTDPLTTAALEAKVGDVAFKRGEPGTAREHLEAALGQLGRRVPRTTVGVVVALLREVLVQVAHTLVPRLFVGRRTLDGQEAARELLAVRIYSRLAYVYWFHSGKLRCGWSHLREMNLAERYPPTPELAQAYSEHAPVMTMVPWYARGIAYAERSYAIRADLGDLWGQGQSLSFKAAALYSASRYREAAQLAQEAVRLLDRTGDRWEANTAGWHLALARYRLGELATAVATASDVHRSAVDIGDQAAAGISLSPWARAAEGAVPPEIVRAQLDRQVDDAHTGSEVRLAEAVRLLAADRPAEAVAVLRIARRVARRAGLRQEYVAPLVPWTATALRLHAATLPLYAHRPRRRMLRKARKAARQAGRLAYWYRNNLPHALREQALLAAMSGRAARARRLLAESLEVAREQEARFEEAQALLARGEVGVALGWRDAEEDLRAGRALAEWCRPAATTDDEPAQAALSLADRFSTLLEVGHAIASASSPGAVYDAVADAALTLLRGQHCHVLEVAPGTDRALSTVGGQVADELSRTAVGRALETGQPVVVDPPEDVDAAESLVLSDVRSLLCAPISCEGRPQACFYVTARIGRLFGEEEVQLAAFIATLASAALDHVAGSEARFRTLAQHSSDVISIVGEDGLITYQSSSVERVFGFGDDDLVGTALEDWAHPEDRPGLAGFVDAARKGTVANGIVTCRLRGRDGTWRHTETTVTNLLADPSVGGVVLNTRDVSDRQALEAELRRRAWHDPLTDLPNRALFTDRVEHALARGARSRDASIVLYLDLDDFKAVNDSMGHAAGDVLLRSVADRLLACVRPGDTVARLGGDEFAVLLDAAPMQDAEQVAGRIVSELGRPFALPGGERSVRVSVGIAAGRPGIDTAEELVSNADTAMFSAKKRGKNRAEIFVPDMRQLRVAASRRKSELDLALSHDELCVYYQPMVAVETGRVVAVEALLRWQHPRLGLLGPADFIPLAEESGQIVPIGSWVLHQACAQAAAWQRSIPAAREVEMCVNLSPRQLEEPGLVADVAAALEASGLAPDRLTLEITENAVVEDIDAAVRVLHALKGLGLRLAVDDFGTGYSALSYLRRFGADVLKVDQSFVADIAEDPDAAALLWAIASLARALRTEVVAEGVETMAQLEMLTTLGCDRAQGYNWSPPVPAPELERWLGAPAPPAQGQLPVRVLLVDDQAHLRGAVGLALGSSPRFVVVGQAADGAAAVELAAAVQPDLVLLDERMPGLSGTEALPGIVAAAPRATVVFLTADDGRRATPAEPPVAAVIDKGRSLDRLVELLEPLLPLAG